jgi:hypothetical protein
VKRTFYTPEAWNSSRLYQYQLYEVPKYDGKNPEEYAYLPYLTLAVLNPLVGVVEQEQ